jgi:hypothetical protein
LAKARSGDEAGSPSFGLADNWKKSFIYFCWKGLGNDGEGPSFRPNLTTGFACDGPKKKKKKKKTGEDLRNVSPFYSKRHESTILNCYYKFLVPFLRSVYLGRKLDNKVDS